MPSVGTELGVEPPLTAKTAGRTWTSNAISEAQSPQLALSFLGSLPLGDVLMKATIVQCNCGAEYRRTEEKFLMPHTGDAVCTACGAALESWSESTHVPIYELIERPDRKLE